MGGHQTEGRSMDTTAYDFIGTGGESPRSRLAAENPTALLFKFSIYSWGTGLSGGAIVHYWWSVYSDRSLLRWWVCFSTYMFTQDTYRQQSLWDKAMLSVVTECDLIRMDPTYNAQTNNSLESILIVLQLFATNWAESTSKINPRSRGKSVQYVSHTCGIQPSVFPA